MRTVIHLSEKELEHFLMIVDQASDMAKAKGAKTSEYLKEYMMGKKGEEDFVIRFASES